MNGTTFVSRSMVVAADRWMDNVFIARYVAISEIRMQLNRLLMVLNWVGDR